MTSEEKRLMEEHRDRQELRDLLAEVVEGWHDFAMKYHGPVFVDGEHAFGVLMRESHEASNAAENTVAAVIDFESSCVGPHCYDHADIVLERLFDLAIDAAEEFVQLAAVASKAKESGFRKPPWKEGGKWVTDTE